MSASASAKRTRRFFRRKVSTIETGRPQLAVVLILPEGEGGLAGDRRPRARHAPADRGYLGHLAQKNAVLARTAATKAVEDYKDAKSVALGAKQDDALSLRAGMVMVNVF